MNINIPFFVKDMGYRIIGYILNIDDNAAKQVFTTTEHLDTNQCRILQEFIDLSRVSRKELFDDIYETVGTARKIEENYHVFNSWRESQGGSILTVEQNDDPVIYLASILAIAVFPIFLIKPLASRRMHSGGAFFQLSSVLHRFREELALAEELKKDPSISQLFGSMIMSSSGTGSSIQPRSLSTNIITNAYELINLRNEISPSNLLIAIEEVIKLLRAAGNGEPINASKFIGCHNIEIENSTEIETECFKFRKYSDKLTELIPEEAMSLPGCILEIQYPYKINKGEDYPSGFKDSQAQFKEMEENLSLAVAFSIPRDPPVGFKTMWSLTFEPFHVPTICWSERSKPPTPSHLLRGSEANDIIYWFELITKIDDRKITIAKRRILSSLNERTNPIDGFIDAIIAWENMFGGRSEISYRISTSIAKLLRDSFEDRLELQKVVSKHYNDRSRIVHGDKEISPEEAKIKRDHCLSIGIECLKKLYKSGYDLIADPKRSEIIILK